MSKIKNGGLDQYGAEPFEQQQFGTAGVEGVKARIFIIINEKCRTSRPPEEHIPPPRPAIAQHLLLISARWPVVPYSLYAISKMAVI